MNQGNFSPDIAAAHRRGILNDSSRGLSSRVIVVALATLFLAACSTSAPEPWPIEIDSGPGGGGPDQGQPDGGSPPVDVDPPDTDVPPPGEVHGPGVATEPATVSRVGQGGFLLRGVVLTPDAILDPGEVLIVGEFITCVASDCSSEAAAETVTLIETNGIISPGLIDGHNHLAYNFLPPWTPDPYRLFNNRYQWADDAAYEWHVRPYAKRRSTGTHYCPAAKWGELRSLIHATTTVQGQSFNQSCVNWGVRNADHHHGLGHNHLATDIGSPRDITDQQAENRVASFEDPDRPITRFAVHMAEGVSGNNLELEFESFAGRDHRTNRHQGISLLDGGRAVLIHSMILTDEQIAETYYTNSKIVWSPSSNISLYGVTAPIEKFLATGIVTGIGPDWTVSGEADILSEMRLALDYGRDQNIDLLTPKKIWEMATKDGAYVVGLHQHIGRLEPGYRADIAVFGRHSTDPYEALIASGPDDVRLVLINGRGLFGDANLGDVAGLNEFCEPFDGCGAEKFICVQESPAADNRRNERLDDIRTQLYNILEGIGYPEDEQYGRGDELLELALCDR
jgi:5-methylthioadenosine/S-adenosylhomocysteine deaminase